MHNNIPIPNKKNIQNTCRNGKNNTNIRKYAHQEHNKTTRINNIKIRTDHDIAPKHISLIKFIENKKTKSDDLLMNKQITKPTNILPYVNFIH